LPQTFLEVSDGRVVPTGDRLHVTRTARALLAGALHYVIAPPPSGFDSWDDFYRSIGVPENELGTGPARIEDPNGEGPRIWFQIVPEKKSIKNRIHIDVNASGGRDVSLDTRCERVETEAARLVYLGATRLHTNVEEGLSTTRSR
jgi:hypothetical protein